MSAFADGPDKGHDPFAELTERDVRALGECMTVLPSGGDVFDVVTESGSSYAVDSRDGRCTCPDFQYRDIVCKHQRRVAYATGERPIPAGVDVDPLLGDHTDETPHVAVTDGGVRVDVGRQPQGSDVENGEESEECDCDGLPDGVPCLDCYIDGAEFEGDA